MKGEDTIQEIRRSWEHISLRVNRWWLPGNRIKLFMKHIRIIIYWPYIACNAWLVSTVNQLCVDEIRYIGKAQLSFDASNDNTSTPNDSPWIDSHLPLFLSTPTTNYTITLACPSQPTRRNRCSSRVHGQEFSFRLCEFEEHLWPPPSNPSRVSKTLVEFMTLSHSWTKATDSWCNGFSCLAW